MRTTGAGGVAHPCVRSASAVRHARKLERMAYCSKPTNPPFSARERPAIVYGTGRVRLKDMMRLGLALDAFGFFLVWLGLSLFRF
ncbi:MAG: hypothetical protein HZB91_01255 [Elusimicrobia bacterium]|nr:hypothetical protein [Elusimicrobiota bacterium]